MGPENIQSTDVNTFSKELQEKLQELRETAADNMQTAPQSKKTWYDSKARDRDFKPGDQVLMLKPRRKHKFEVLWEGPFQVIHKISKVNYLINANGEHVKTF